MLRSLEDFDFGIRPRLALLGEGVRELLSPTTERDIDPFSPVSFELFLLRHDGLLSGAGDFLEGAGDRDTELGVRRPSGDVEDIFVL